jgi:hypothetical protein
MFGRMILLTAGFAHETINVKITILISMKFCQLDNINLMITISVIIIKELLLTIC